MELRRHDDAARAALERFKKKFDSKMTILSKKRMKVLEEEKELENNMIKFNTFVKEKQLKVQRGIELFVCFQKIAICLFSGIQKVIW